MTPRLRLSAQGVVAVYDPRSYGGRTTPWQVVYVPPGVTAHWPTKSLSEQAVASWAVLRASEPSEDPTYYLPADAENRFREYVKGVVFGQVDERIGMAWKLYQRVLTAFPADAPTEETS